MISLVTSCRQIFVDCTFLESQRIIDYSLLLGLHFRAPEHLKSLREYQDADQYCGSSQTTGMFLCDCNPLFKVDSFYEKYRREMKIIGVITVMGYFIH